MSLGFAIVTILREFLESTRLRFANKQKLTKCRIKMGTRTATIRWHASGKYLQLWIGTHPSCSLTPLASHADLLSIASIHRCSIVSLARTHTCLKICKEERGNGPDTFKSYITSILGFKISLLLAFWRIAANQTYRHVIIGIMIACIVFHISFLIVQINLCQPVSLASQNGNGTCLLTHR